MKKLFLLFITALLIFPMFSSSAATTGEIKTFTTTIQNKQRTYLVYRPLICKNKTCPVLFMFHGIGGTAQQAADNYGWKETADKNNFIAVFPESLTLPKKDAIVFGINYYPNYDPAGKHWDIANITLPLLQRYKTQDTEFVSTIIDQLNTNYKILKTHIFTTGHSYGAFFSYYISMCLPDKITAFASHSGGYTKYFMNYDFPISARNAKNNAAYLMPGIVLHSPKDTTVSYQWSVNLVNEMKAKSQPYQFITLADSLLHNWDLTKNQAQWDFFVKNSTAIK